MKTDYKVGDWVEVLENDPEHNEIKPGDKFRILAVGVNSVGVHIPGECNLGVLEVGNIKPVTIHHSQELSILSKAEAIISGQRQTVNGKPERSFEQIAARWSLTVGSTITAQQVALMMVDMKMVRALQGVTTEGHDDHFVDMAGYVALAAELGDK